MYGMQINDALGNTYYDSSSESGVFVEFLTLFITGSGLDRYVTYNGVDGKANLQGRKLKLITLYSGDHWHEAIDNGTSGYPQIKYNETRPNVPANNIRRGTILMVLAR